MTRTLFLVLLLVLLAGLLAACVRVRVHGDRDAWARDTAANGPQALRIATYNTSLYDEAPGGLVARLQAGDDGARNVAAVLQRVRPDIVLLNEFDYDAEGRAADLFQRNYLEVAQPGGVGCAASTWMRPMGVRTGTSQCDLDDSRSCDQTSAGYQGACVAGSIGWRAPGIVLQRSRWKLRACRASMGCRESRSMPYWPGCRP